MSDVENYGVIAIRLLQIVVIPALGYGLYILRDIRERINTLNGRMIRQEQWNAGHEQLDVSRFDDLEMGMRQLREDMHRSGATRGSSRR